MPRVARDDKKYQCYVVVVRGTRTLQIVSHRREQRVQSILRSLVQNQQAATLIEYSLIVALIAVATASGMDAVGGSVMAVMAAAANAMN